MPRSIEIVELTEQRIGDLVELMFGFFNELREKQGGRPPSKSSIAQDVARISNTDDIVLMAYFGETPVGFIRISARGEGTPLWIEELFVVPKFRRKGIGRELVHAAERKAVERGEKNLYFMVVPQDKTAIMFWKSMGYTILNTLELTRNLDDSEMRKEMLTVEFMGSKFDIFRWANPMFNELESEFLQLLKRFYEVGGTQDDFLRIVNGTIREYLKRA